MRPDLTDHVIHFTCGKTDEGAYGTLRTILHEHRLLGGFGHIRGGYKCVCFSELSLALLRHGFVNKRGESRYSMFGIMVSKTWLFEQGGRPVIYQPDEEFDNLSESHRWRHVRFEPSREIDFTWEREWRIQTDELRFDSSIADVVVPGYEWVKRLEKDHQRDQDFQVRQFSQIFDEEIAEIYREEFPWFVRYGAAD